MVPVLAPWFSELHLELFDTFYFDDDLQTLRSDIENVSDTELTTREVCQI